MNLKDKKITIIGMSKTGKSTSVVLKNLGAEVFIMDKKKREEIEDFSFFENLGVNIITGGHKKDILLNSYLIVLSPGVPIDLPEIEEAKISGIPVMSEIELAYQINPDMYLIAITGTNGKTTTTTLIYEILKNSNKDVKIAGNIGIPLIEEIQEKNKIIVTEISSFQLEGIEKFRPKISVFLNITPDHLERHKSFEEYLRIKKRIFENQKSSDYAILNYDDEIVRNFKKEIIPKTIFFSSKKELGEGVFLKDNKILISISNKKYFVCEVQDIKIRGEHNLQNALAAISASFLAGANIEKMSKTLKEFKGVEHRQEEVTEIKGILFINDSKGTNPDSTIKAVHSYSSPIILIAGGKDKNVSFKKLAEEIGKKIKFLIVLGETAEKIKNEFEKIGFSNIKKVKDLKEAVKSSFEIAEKGDIVLFSPSCSSFDMFKNFEERGKIFKDEVYKLKKEIEENL
jgi:UDP-N-acetylmuramoylalanine--D-glutamate ligase